MQKRGRKREVELSNAEENSPFLALKKAYRRKEGPIIRRTDRPSDGQTGHPTDGQNLIHQLVINDYSILVNTVMLWDIFRKDR